ncbi:hypothetical protein [Bradyrhizobium sp. JYMT SZCCT0428]|uniref:hypothetical protein n=1 Tax=Bradyrhizobium sp. JYMT SZCCT0428 TaxID=2807673 RepID=UPI001BA70143|nr:hypothetical protein [Bradyrhizobium sp. JYMT SZCCT0428]MBR1154185.1 hypothetical protein [Bradyrhizobium sp. JYMT SZCCT0428]
MRYLHSSAGMWFSLIVLASSPLALAEEQIERDVLGLKIGMSYDEAVTVLKKRNLTLKEVTDSDPISQKSYVWYLSGAEGNQGKDGLSALMSAPIPASKVMAIQRKTVFPNGAPPSANELVQVLTEKYGTPSRRSNSRSRDPFESDRRNYIHLTWLSSSTLKTFADFAPLTRISEHNCYKAEPSLPILLLTDAKNGRYQKYFLYDRFRDGALENRFCDTFLTAVIVLVGQSDHSESLTVKMTDFNQAAQEARRYSEWLAETKRKAEPPKGKIPDL